VIREFPPSVGRLQKPFSFCKLNFFLQFALKFLQINMFLNIMGVGNRS